MESDKIDLYSRQIATYGIDTIEKLSNLRILIIGLRGLGMEIAKNLILSGPKEIFLYDKNTITLYDLGSGFYFSENQIDKYCRDEGCLKKLSKLNSYVKVEILKEDLFSSIIMFNVVIITEIMDEEELYKINDICRNNNIGFIYGCVFGLIGFVFVDFGQNFIIYDKFGRNSKKFFIKNITNEKNCTISIDPSSIESNFLTNDDFITIKDVEGMTELNNNIPQQIKIISNNEISINIDSTHFKKYIKGGLIEEFKKKIKKNYLSFKENLENPICEEDFLDDKNTFQRHSFIVGLHKYFNKHKKLPELNELVQASEVLEYCKEYFERKKREQNKLFIESECLDEEYIKNLSRWSKAELSPYCNFFGGIISQEAIKYTGKYIPLDQWAWFDFHDSIKTYEKANRELVNSKYDEQIAIYGQELQEKIFNSNIFLIGAGALGCEYLKIFSLMGISKNNNKKIVVTDNDNIEISNLNRQFLFRKKHEKKSKSLIASKQIIKINADSHCEAHQNLISQDTEFIYTEDFWKSQDFVINAVDNIKARKYIDYQCTLFNRILIDSGTEGTKANSQLIIPRKTKSYNETNITEAKRQTIPMCTLRQFPSTIEHCIEWSKNKFNEYFFDDIKNILKFIINPKEYLNQIKDDENKLNILKKFKTILEIKSEMNIEKTIKLAKKEFLTLFNYEIKNIIDIFPKDYKTKDNIYFWSGAKKFPSALDFNIQDDESIKFIEYYTKILLHSLNVQIPYNYKIIDCLINLKDEKEFEKIDISDENLILLAGKVDINSIAPEIFEKDNDLNNHINFIHICSNLRAKNYHIDQCSKLEARLISGNIIPSISSTTSSITGFAASQIYTLLYSNDVNLLKEIRFNMATNSYFIFNPQIVVGKKNIQGRNKLIIAVPEKWNCWDHIDINGSLTIKEIIKNIKDKYNITVKGLFSYDNKCLIKNKEMLNYKLENAFSIALDKKLNELRRTLSFTVDGKNENNNSVIMPVFLYHY